MSTTRSAHIERTLITRPPARRRSARSQPMLVQAESLQRESVADGARVDVLPELIPGEQNDSGDRLPCLRRRLALTGHRDVEEERVRLPEQAGFRAAIASLLRELAQRLIAGRNPRRAETAREFQL